MKVTIVDYAGGNAQAVVRALAEVGADPLVSRERDDIARSDFIVLPGVGHAGTALQTLRSHDLIGPLEDAVLGRGTPVLGICLGMQIMVDRVEEGGGAGLGWIRGRTVELAVADPRRYKVPHIGWNSVIGDARARLVPAAGEAVEYYFCHKYTVVDVADVESNASFHYESDRIATCERGNLFGVQFHPEKSQAAGAALFRRFLTAR